jgi:hypothetical protein
MTSNYVYTVQSIDAREISVIWNGERSEIAISGWTHATVDEAYAGDAAGLSLAIYRAHYIAGRLKNGFAAESLQIAVAIHAMGPRAAHRKWIDLSPDVCKTDAARVFVCADCCYPSRLPAECDNPGCLANPHSNHTALREQATKAATRKAEDDARQAFRASLKRSGFTAAF